MDKAEVQSIIHMTIQELKRQGMLKDRYSVIIKNIDPVIKEYFLRKNNKKIEFFLRDNSDDPYIDVIYLHYRDGMTLEKIAGVLDKDTSTVKRNKKRLIMELYDVLER